MKKRFRIFAGLLCLLAPLEMQAQEPAAAADGYIKSHYTKYEYRIPMRDGVRLFTSVYAPKDSAFPQPENPGDGGENPGGGGKDRKGNAEAGRWPILMDRTPYSVAPYGEDQYKKHLGPSDELEKSGYIFVYQDVRGRYMSEGTFVEMTPSIDVKKSKSDVDESSDTYDTVEYLLKHLASNNGKVGIWGISYPGFYTSASIIDSHPAIKAASPQAPMTDLFLGDDSYHGGAFMLSGNFGFYPDFWQFSKPGTKEPVPFPFSFGTADGYQFYLNAGPTKNLDMKELRGESALFHDQLVHTTYDDYWKRRNLAPHMHGVKAAVMTVGGWFDAEDLSGPLKTYNAIEKLNPGTTNTIVIGPWVHGGWARTDGDHLGDVQFDAKTAEFFRQEIQFPFFEHYLKGTDAAPLPEAYMFETGTNVWRRYDVWPPKQASAKTLYFHAGGKLSFDPPTEDAGVDQYISDPAHPVPFVNYMTTVVPQRYMVDDQRFASERPDVLTYETDPLAEDVTIAGPVSPKLSIASSGTDSDFVVKLIDVYPDDYPNPPEEAQGKRMLGAPPIEMGGYEQLLRGEPMRAKFRNSWSTPEPLVPGKMTTLNFAMPDLNHTFRAGHRIMVQVQSSWFPLVDRNPQTFTDIPNANVSDFKQATEQVFRSKSSASGVEVLVMPRP